MVIPRTTPVFHPPTYGLPAVGLLITAFAWLPLGVIAPIALSIDGAVAARVAIVVALGVWCWIQTRVGRALAVLDRAPEPALHMRIWFGVVAAFGLTIAAALTLRAMLEHYGLTNVTVHISWSHWISLLVALSLAFVASPLLLLFVVRRERVRRHLAAALDGKVAYYGSDRAIAQVGVAMVFLHSLSIVIKIPFVIGVLLMADSLASPAAWTDPAGGLVLTAIAFAIALWCGKSVLALRLGWAATQGRVEPAAFVRRAHRYRIASWMSAALVCIAAAAGDRDGRWLDQLAFVGAIVPCIVTWPIVLGTFVRRMQREAPLAGSFVADPNRGLVVGGWILLGGSVFTLFGLQLDWVPFANAVAPKAHPGVGAALLYAGFCGWAAIEALAQTSRARLAVVLFGLFSLVYLPIAAILVAAGVGTATASLTSIGGPRTIVSGTFLWVAPLLPTLLLSAIALGAGKSDTRGNA